MIEKGQIIDPRTGDMAAYHELLIQKYNNPLPLPGVVFELESCRSEGNILEFSIHEEEARNAQEVSVITLQLYASRAAFGVIDVEVDRNQGFGPATYLTAAAFAHSHGHSLRSGRSGGATQEAVNRWGKFASRGLATVHSPFYQRITGEFRGYAEIPPPKL